MLETRDLTPFEDALVRTISPRALPPEAVPVATFIMRELAKGAPVPLGRVADQFDRSISEVAAIMHSFSAMGFAELKGDEIAAMVLSLGHTRHQFTVDDRKLYAWCALDTLFLPAILGKQATIRSTCPQTNQAIELVVSPSGIENASPKNTFVSVVAPGVTPGISASCGGALAGKEGSFCSNVVFLASEDVAKEWLETREGATVLPLDEAFTLAQRVWAEPFTRAPNAQAAGAQA